MTTENTLTPSDIRRQLPGLLSDRARDYWANMIGNDANDVIVTAQREGIDAAVQLVESLATPEATNDDMIRELCIITTRDQAGRHFTEWAEHYEALEAAGWIRIDRPVHTATGIPYGMDSWSIEVTAEGQEVVDANPELHPA